MTVIIGLDIEGRGPSPKRNGIISIGVCVSSLDGQTRALRRFSMEKLSGQTFDEKCLTEFWAPYIHNLKQLQYEATDAETAMTDFRALLDQYPDAYIVTDCPAYDITFINYYLDYFDLPLIHFKRTVGGIVFRPIHDTDSYARGKMNMGFAPDDIWVDNDKVSQQRGLELIPKGSHMPDLDAEHIVLHHIQTITH